MICVEYYDFHRHFQKLINLKLREADERELLASTGLSVRQGLAKAAELSTIVCYVYLDAEKNIVAISGAAKTMTKGVASVWAMATDTVFDHWGEIEPLFEKHVNSVFDYTGIEVIGNVIDLRNTAHIRWIKKLGFTMTGYTIELNGIKFEGFYKRRNLNV